MTVPTSYATLRTAIAERRERVGDAAYEAEIPGFIALAEAGLNRQAPVRLAEVDAALTATPGTRFVALPADFLEAIGLTLTTSGVDERLAPLAASAMAVSEAAGPPAYWAIDGGNIAFPAPADQAHTLRLRYRKKLFELAATDPNWLLTNHPDVYLFAALVEAADHELDEAASVKYAVRLERALDEVRWLDGRAKAVPLRVDPALLAAPRFTIAAG